jgi:hypothetical protein
MSIWSLNGIIKSTLDIIKPETDKIDSAAINGLSGVSNSLGYKIEEIERHIHGQEKWLGLAASPSGETHRADEMDGSIQPFQLVSGNNDFGPWLQVLGSSDTPIKSGNLFFDAHRYLVTSTNSTSPFIIQAVEGESADLASKIANKDYTAVPYISATNNNDSGIEGIMSSRVPAGSKVWLRCACVGQNGPVINFYYGIHEYEG